MGGRGAGRRSALRAAVRRNLTAAVRRALPAGDVGDGGDARDAGDAGEVGAAAQLRPMLDASPVALAVLDRDLRYRYINQTLAAMNGVSAAESVGRTPMEVVPTLPPKSYLPFMRDVLDGRMLLHRIELEGETEAEPGVVRCWEETFFAVRDDEGRVDGVGIVAVDVTERKAAEAALRQSEATLRLILDSAPNGLLLADRNGRVHAVNRECSRLFGYEQDELVGKPVEVLVPSSVRDGHAGHRDTFFGRPSTRLMGHGRDLRGMRKDGTEFPVEVGLAVTRGAPGLVTCVITDISERKKIEAERAALLAAERAAGDRLARLQRVTEAGLAGLPMPELLQELLERVLDAVAADGAAILLPDEDGTYLRLAAGVGLQAEMLDMPPIRVGTGVAGQILRDGRARVVPDTGTAPELVAAELGDLRCLLSLPMVVEGTVIGVLEVAGRLPGRFTEADIEVLQPFADRVALSVDRARAFERERDIAETLQRNLLPAQLPQLDGATVAAYYLPGAAGMQVGGDWYDVLDLPDGSVVLVIGDVMGRGVRAASVMGQLRAAVRIYVDMGVDLPEVVSHLNHAVLGMGENEMATLMLARLRPATGELEWLSAGHVPAVLRSPDGSTRLLDGEDSPDRHGIALGVIPDATYAVTVETLEPGATLLLYTDGLVERSDVSLESRLQALTAATSAGPADADGCCQAVQAALLPSARSSDDVALLALHLEPVAVRPLDLVLPPTAEALADARVELRAWLDAAGATDDEAQDVLLAVGEALTRSTGDPVSDGTCLVRIRLAGDRVEVVLLGAGTSTPPHGTDRGRGLVLMESVLHELSIQRQASDGAEELRLVRRLDAPTRP